MNKTMTQFGRLFVRQPDHSFESFEELYNTAYREQESARVHWTPPANLYATEHEKRFKLKITGDSAYELTDWSFSQLCSYLNTDRKVIDGLALDTAAKVVTEVLPKGGKPLQLYTIGGSMRSIHPISYERLSNSDVLEVVIDEASELTECRNPSLKSPTCFMGDRDMFAFLFDETEWMVYREERFAPALVVWNSEVGGRSVGIRSGWFHAASKSFLICDDDDAIAYSRRHSFGVRESLGQIRDRIHLWQASCDVRFEHFLFRLREVSSEPFADSFPAMRKQLMYLGLSLELARLVEKWLSKESQLLSRFNVSMACLRSVREATFASTRFEVGQIANKVMVDSKSSIPKSALGIQ